MAYSSLAIAYLNLPQVSTGKLLELSPACQTKMLLVPGLI
jgi:hypothetical protein